MFVRLIKFVWKNINDVNLKVTYIYILFYRLIFEYYITLWFYWYRPIFLQVSIVDFQLARYGSPALDLVSLLYCCVSAELRKRCLPELLDEYYDSIVNLLTQTNCLHHYPDIRHKLVRPIFSRLTQYRCLNSILETNTFIVYLGYRRVLKRRRFLYPPHPEIWNIFLLKFLG